MQEFIINSALGVPDAAEAHAGLCDAVISVDPSQPARVELSDATPSPVALQLFFAVFASLDSAGLTIEQGPHAAEWLARIRPEGAPA